MKYKIDSIIIINNQPWRVAGYSFRFGKEWQYTLQTETTDGIYKTIYMRTCQTSLYKQSYTSVYIHL